MHDCCMATNLALLRTCMLWRQYRCKGHSERHLHQSLHRLYDHKLFDFLISSPYKCVLRTWLTFYLSSRGCVAGVAGYTWVAILHLWWGLSFRTTLMLANITSMAWLFIYHAVLPPRKSEAVSQLHTLTSRSSSVTGLPLDQTHAGHEPEAAVETLLDPLEHQVHSRSNADAETTMVQPPPSPPPRPISKPPRPLSPAHFMSVW